MSSIDLFREVATKKGVGEFLLGAKIESVLAAYGKPEGSAHKSKTSAGGEGEIVQYYKVQLWTSANGIVERLFFELKKCDDTNQVFPDWNAKVERLSKCNLVEFEESFESFKVKNHGDTYHANAAFKDIVIFAIFSDDQQTEKQVMSRLRFNLVAADAM